MLYTEDVCSHRPLSIAVLALSAGFAAAGLGLSVGANDLSGLGLVAAAALFAAIWRLFAVLHVKVGVDRVQARFGPFGLNLRSEQIESARAETYRWGSYYGWGLRWGIDEGRPGRAMSVPFLRSGVIVETKQGNRHYINSRRPERLAAAVNRLAEGGSSSE